MTLYRRKGKSLLESLADCIVAQNITQRNDTSIFFFSFCAEHSLPIASSTTKRNDDSNAKYTVETGYKKAGYKKIRIQERDRQGPGRTALCYYLE
jgi:hypothetical protein